MLAVAARPACGPLCPAAGGFEALPLLRARVPREVDVGGGVAGVGVAVAAGGAGAGGGHQPRPGRTVPHSSCRPNLVLSWTCRVMMGSRAARMNPSWVSRPAGWSAVLLLVLVG